MERDNAGARIILIEGWEHLVKTTASKILGNELTAYKRAVRGWDGELKEAIGIRRKAHARYTSSKTTAGWEEYTIIATTAERK